ncbi:MAG TPA: hypothetical protein VF163_18455 [Micromonosporaceae bacterium]
MNEVPMPRAVAARPRDPRGYPVPAITPWADGAPVFAATGIARTYLCAVERRCSICGTTMAPGPVWRVVAGPEADAIEAALAAGQQYRNLAATAEAPGHRACMLYAAVVCPYLARPNARRGQAGDAHAMTATRGDRRGAGGAVAGFEEVDFRLGEHVLFRFAGLCEFRRHEVGLEQLDALTEAVQAEAVRAEAVRAEAGSAATELAPLYLLDDEDAAHRQMRSHLGMSMS